MSQPSDLNPYAPPKADTDGFSSRSRDRRHARADLNEALARLDEHLSDPEKVRQDLAAAGPRVRPVTIVMGIIGAAGIGGLVLSIAGPPGPLFVVSLIATIFFGVLGAVLLVLDLSLVPHGQGSPPEAALKSYLKAMGMGRNGYAWAALCPTAREQTVSTPALGEIETAPTRVAMENQEAMKSYAGSFARAGGNQMRTMAVKRVTVVDVKEDVAVVEAELSFQSWPRWVSIIIAVSFVIFRLAAVIGLVLYFVLRKRHETRVQKTLIRGRDGAWYVFDADLLEGAG